MSFNLASKQRHRLNRPAWSGTAFLVEALVLLIFIAASAAVFVQLYEHAASQAAESRDLSQAVAAATDVAERFAANPASVEEVTDAGDMTVVCTATEEPAGSGTLHHATITVYQDDATAATDSEPLYTITTARYMGGEGR